MGEAKVRPKTFHLGIRKHMQRLKWDNKEVSIDGRLINYLRFADDTDLLQQLIMIETMTGELDTVAKKWT